MLSPLPMLRLNLLVLQKDQRAVLRLLGESAAVQLVRAEAGPQSATEVPRDRSMEIARCETLVAQMEEMRRALEMQPLEASTPVKPITLAEAEEKFRVMEAKAGGLLRRRQELLQRLARVTDDGEQISRFCGLDLPLEKADRFTFLHFTTGLVPARNLPALQTEIAENVALLALPGHGDWQSLIAMSTRQAQAGLEQALQRAGFQAQTLPEVRGTTADSFYQDSLHEQESVSEELAKLNNALRNLAGQYAHSLAELQNCIELERRLLEVEQNFPGTRSASLISGWVPAEDAPDLAVRVSQAVEGRCVLQTTAPEHLTLEDTPVLLRHTRWLRPFEMLVAAYGLPQYREIEPTLFVAVSYVLMFGMMFGDLGHGAVLAAAGWGLLLLSHRPKRRDLGLMLLCGGCSSMAFGAIYGSCFGIPSFKGYALWRDPLEGDPMSLMLVAISMGIALMSVGMLINVINRFRRGDVIGGFLDKFGLIGMLFYWGSLLALTGFETVHTRGLLRAALFAFVVLPLIGWSLKEPLEYFVRHRAAHAAEQSGGLVAALTESLVGAFEAVLSYLANTISFVRLAAYAMSHAALLAAAFLMAAQVRHLHPGGGLLSVAVIVLGNIVAIALEGIIASVQALRLEYYEFFGKFFSGAGKPFQPFRLTALPG